VDHPPVLLPSGGGREAPGIDCRDLFYVARLISPTRIQCSHQGRSFPVRALENLRGGGPHNRPKRVRDEVAKKFCRRGGTWGVRYGAELSFARRRGTPLRIPRDDSASGWDVANWVPPKLRGAGCPLWFLEGFFLRNQFSATRLFVAVLPGKPPRQDFQETRTPTQALVSGHFCLKKNGPGAAAFVKNARARAEKR